MMKWLTGALNFLGGLSFEVKVLIAVAVIAATGLGILFVDSKTIAGLKVQVAANAACVASIGPGARPGQDPASLCAAPIAAAHLAAVRSAGCDAALAANPQNVFAARAACGAPVLALIADRDADAHQVDSLGAQLTAERAGQAAAIARAQSAAVTETERNARAKAAVDAAPRDGDGLVVCDADCMRARWSAAAPAAAP